MKHLIFLLCAFSFAQSPYAGYWQQDVDYVMDIRMDVETFRFSGTQQLTYTNHGTDDEDSMDYPDTIHPVAEDVSNQKSDIGIIICGSGNGANITANKHKSIRSALCWNCLLYTSPSPRD